MYGTGIVICIPDVIAFDDPLFGPAAFHFAYIPPVRGRREYCLPVLGSACGNQVRECPVKVHACIQEETIIPERLRDDTFSKEGPVLVHQHFLFPVEIRKPLEVYVLADCATALFQQNGIYLYLYY